MNKQPGERSDSANQLWRVRLLDGPLLEDQAGQSVRRFRSQRVGALLAYLALRLGRPCPREELYNALWPEEADMRLAANRLRVALASLRKQLELPGVPFGAVLDVSDTGRIRLRRETVWCDIDAMEAELQAGRKTEAARLLNGTLLPGYYDEWILAERARWERLREEWEPLRIPASTPEPVPPLFAPTQVGRRSPVPLPSYITRFFGREDEQERLLTLLSANRLVTLTGPGGMGKTRLAVESAHRAHLPAVWVSLAEGTASGHVAEAILRALHVTPTLEADLVEQIIAVLLRREPVLLLLDNAEHLVETVADVASRLLRAVPDLVLLVTSRQSLNVVGESLLPLGSMETPASDTPVADLINIPAIALFVDRARSARPDFTPAPRHAAALLHICRLLEGMPLALELAAARVVIQTPAQIAATLQAGLLHLQSQQRGFAVRHRSLRAAIQGSVELLPPETQTFFAALSVFQGGWTTEAARIVTGCQHAETLLEDLSRRSLLRLREDESTQTLRGTLLESIRQFAQSQVTDAHRENLALCHADYYLKLAGRISEDDIDTLRPLDAEQENLLTALEIGGRDKLDSFWQGVTGALIYAHVRGRHRVFLPWAERVLTLAPDASDVDARTRLRFAAYTILSYSGQLPRLPAIAAEIQRDADAHHSLYAQIHAQLITCWVLGQRKDYAAFDPLARQTLAQARLVDDPTALRRVLRITAFLFGHYGATLASDNPQAALILRQESEQWTREFLALAPASSTQLSYVKHTLVTLLQSQGREEEAYALLKDAQQTALAQENTSMLLFAFRAEADIVLTHGLYAYAALLYGAYYALKEQTGYNTNPAQTPYDAPPESLPAQFAPEVYTRLLQLGSTLPHAFLAALSLTQPPTFDALFRLASPLATPV